MGVFQFNSITRATSGPTVDPRRAVAIFSVLGTSSTQPADELGGAGPIMFANDAQPETDYGYGRMPETAAIITSYSGQATIGVRMSEADPGSYGAIDVSGFTGTAIPVADTTLEPFNDHELYVHFTTGGSVGAAGPVYKKSYDYGRTYRPGETRLALGGDTSISFARAGAAIRFDPPAAQVTAFIAAVVEARADTLAHLADVVAHDAADTSAAQVALAASAAPTTESEAWAVLNLCYAAFESHRLNITVHNGPDPVNVIAHGVATDVHTGIDLFIEYKADFNAHLGVALAAAVAGLKIATNTVAAPVTLTAADLLAPGLAALALYPRRLTFTTAGVTPSDAPAFVDIDGTDVADDDTLETRNLAQTAATVESVSAYETIETLDYPAADGTAATIAIGYGMGVHNSADVTNVITSAAPTHGTIVAGDVIKLPTNAPTWDATGLGEALTEADVLPAGRLTGYTKAYGGIVIVGRFPVAAWTTLINGLDALRARQRSVIAIIEARLPNTGESAAAYLASLEAEWAGLYDPRVYVVTGDGRFDPTRIAKERYESRRLQTAPLCARLAAVDYATSPGLIGESTRKQGVPSAFGGPLDGYKIRDSRGVLVGVDGFLDGGAATAAGFGAVCSVPNTDDLRCYVMEPFMRAPAGDTAPHVAHQRVASVVETIIYIEGTKLVQAQLARELGRTTIRPDSADRINSAIYGAVIRAVGDPSATPTPRITSFAFAVDKLADITVDPVVLPWSATLETVEYVSRLSGVFSINGGV